MDYRCISCLTRLRVTSGSSALAPEDRCPVCAASLEKAPIVFTRVHRLVAIATAQESPAMLRGEFRLAEQPGEVRQAEFASIEAPPVGDFSPPPSFTPEPGEVEETGDEDFTSTPERVSQALPGSAPGSDDVESADEPEAPRTHETSATGGRASGTGEVTEEFGTAEGEEPDFGAGEADAAPEPAVPAGRQRLLGTVLGGLAGGVGAGGLVLAPFFLGSEVPSLLPLSAGLIATGAAAGFLFAPRRRD